MNPEEVLALARRVIAYALSNDTEVDQLVQHILETVRDNDDDPLTTKSIVSHPDYDKDEDAHDVDTDYRYHIGDIDFVWWSDGDFDVMFRDVELYPQPKTWGELRYLAKMLNAKLESA